MIPLARPDINFDEVSSEIATILASGQLTSGKYVREFEQYVAEYVGVRHAFATTSATTALHLALVSANVGRGDEVLVSDFTFPASGNAIVQTGATPILVDCCTDSFLLDLDHAKQQLTPRTKAIMPVATFGCPLDMDAVERFASENGLIIIEDAACSLGAQRRGRRSGTMEGLACFSFHPRKIITTGEGGMLTTNDNTLAERIQLLRTHGGRRDGENSVGLKFHEFGYNYRMSEIQATLGTVQMKRLDRTIEIRRQIANRYSKILSEMTGVHCPQFSNTVIETFQSYVVLLDEYVDRNEVIRQMRSRGIETTLGTYAMHCQPVYGRLGYKPGDLPNAFRAQTQSLTLPLFTGMSEDDTTYVATTLLDIVAMKS